MGPHGQLKRVAIRIASLFTVKFLLLTVYISNQLSDRLLVEALYSCQFADTVVIMLMFGTRFIKFITREIMSLKLHY